MAEVATLARPYANALFDVAKSAGELDRWSRMLGLLSATAQDDKVQRMLQGPDMAEAAKAGNKRMSLLTEITIQFETLSALEQRSLDVVVISAYPLSADEELTLKASLRVRFDKEISMTSEVDPKLIGGAIIRAGDTVIDGSLRGKLDKLAETIQRT